MKRLLSILTVLAGCGPDEPPTFTQVQSQVFDVSCVFSACHMGANPAGGMNLTTNGYDDIVNVASTLDPSKVRVKPGDPAGSYILDELEERGLSDTGEMPPNAPLESERIDLVRRWIEAGAPNN